MPRPVQDAVTQMFSVFLLQPYNETISHSKRFIAQKSTKGQLAYWLTMYCDRKHYLPQPTDLASGI